MKIEGVNYNNTNKFMYFLIVIYFLFIYCISTTVFPYRSIALAFIGLIIFFMQILIGKKPIYMDRISLSVLVIYVIMIFSSLINRDTFFLQTVQRFIQVIFTYIGIVSFCDSDEKFIKISKIIFWTGFIGGPIAGLYQMIVGRYIFPLPLDSVYESNMLIKTVISSALQYNANLVALQFVSTFFIGLYLYKVCRRKLTLLACITCVIGILLTFSRTTIIATIISLIIYRLMQKKNFNSSKLILLYFGLITFTILIYFNFQSILDNILQLGDVKYVFRLKSSENVSIRFMQWAAVKEAIFSANIIQLIFGYGENYVNILGYITGYNITAHNTILEQLIKNGIISCILLICSYYYTLKALWVAYRTRDEYRALFCGMVAILISLQMISAFSFDSIMYLMIASILLKKGMDGEKKYAKAR